MRKVALTDPVRGQELLQSYGDNVKVPLYIQGAIHGNEYEGVEAIFETLERLATTPYGADPEVDAVLDHTVLLFNVIQNPDGRVAGTRANGNGFDLNRDFMTQSQTETRASVAVMQKWLPPEVLDLHGYVTPTLIEATTKPHNPSIDYDLWLKWNQPRIDANEAALAALNFDVTRPINDWCSDGSQPPPGGICPDGQPPGPAVAEGWDDWGPFYTPMYAQHVGLNGSTVEMCRDPDCAVPGTTPAALGRLGSRIIQETVVWSSLLFDLENRNELLFDEVERYRRGVANEPRPPCCEPPFDVDNNWMEEFPTAYIVPMGSGQRSEPEANRLVDWLLANGILVDQLKQAYTFDGVTYPAGSYVVLMNQAHRGLADTALGIGADISEDISILYAPPAAWSHGYLWGADVVRVAAGATTFSAADQPDPQGQPPARRRRAGPGDRLRPEDRLADGGAHAQRAHGRGAHRSSWRWRRSPPRAAARLPTGSAIFAADSATKVRLASIGRANDVWFHRVGTSAPPTEPIDRMPRILVLTGALNQDVWSLQNLGFTPAFMSTAQLNAAAQDPLPAIDVIWNTGGLPASGQRHGTGPPTAFFAAGGGYIGAGANGANFLTSGGLVTGLTPPRCRPAPEPAASSTGTTSAARPARSPARVPAGTRRSWTRPPGSPPCRRR